jgi:hypothetical protein
MCAESVTEVHPAFVLEMAGFGFMRDFRDGKVAPVRDVAVNGGVLYRV